MVMLTGRLVKTVTSDGFELQGFWIDMGGDTAVFHSHGTAGDFYTHKFIDVIGGRVSGMGVSFLTANNRGHDVYAYLRRYIDGRVRWVQVGGAFERFEDCIFDIEGWLDFLEGEGVRRVVLEGHSLCQKLLYYQSLRSDRRVAGQIYLSPGSDASYMYYSLGVERFREVNSMVRRMVEEGRGEELLPRELAIVCPMGALAYYGYMSEEGAGNLYPYHDPESPRWEALSKLKEPMLIVFGGADKLIKPSVDVAARMFRERGGGSRVEVRVVEGANHSFIGFEDELSEIIVEWLGRKFM
ncbi:DUF1749 domain-containing protein [Candidatus Bathyarchaeota archaeon]|nr:DUF1749 domain-containing protein [Candidatus Bathyarchaeota archaeon]MBS7629838.1 DUF1749 domain-containing protein [Candidatus Bathyarchaeota archaeon]